MQEMKLQDLKTKSPTELLSFAEEVAVENASAMRKQELMFAILKQLAARDVDITGDRRGRGAAGRLRLPALARTRTISPAPTTSTSRPRRSAASACAPATRSKARSAARRKASAISRCSRSTPSISTTRRKQRHKVHFDNLTPLYPDERLQMEVEKPTSKDQTGRVIDIVAPLGKGQRAPDRGAAAHRQDRDPAEHRPLDHRQSPGMLSDRAADRRAARRSDRHAALGEGRGDLLDLRRACLAPRAGRRDGDREGKAPGRARSATW